MIYLDICLTKMFFMILIYLAVFYIVYNYLYNSIIFSYSTLLCYPSLNKAGYPFEQCFYLDLNKKMANISGFSWVILVFWSCNVLLLLTLHKKMKFSIKDFFGKYDQIRRKMRVWSHLLQKRLMENFVFCVV